MNTNMQDAVKLFLKKLQVMHIDISGYKLSDDFTELLRYTGTDKDVKIPPVRSIGESCFSGEKKIVNGYMKTKHCSARVLVIPDSVEEIGWSAFSDSILDKLVLGKGIRDIEQFAFFRAVVNSPISIPSSVKIIGSKAFTTAVFDDVTIENGVKEVEEEAFEHSKVNTLRIPSSMVEIGCKAFDNNTRVQLYG